MAREEQEPIERIRAEHGKCERRRRPTTRRSERWPRTPVRPSRGARDVPVAQRKTERQRPGNPAKQQAGGHETDHSANPITTSESIKPTARSAWRVALTCLTIS